MSVKCRKFVLKSHFSGLPKREDLEIVEETLPALKDGEFLCQSEWLSVDPYMRMMSAKLPLGSTMMGTQVARIIESKNAAFPVGEYAVASYGWATHGVCNSSNSALLDPSVPTDKCSTGLGVLGMPGATAYLGVRNVCQPKSGETLLINAAAGAVGSAVGQIAKIKGCRVIGFAGSDAKVEYLKSLGFDVAINYKTMSSLDAVLKEHCPNGIDSYFDNVGGEFFATVLLHMNRFGRVCICGTLSEYNPDNPVMVPSVCRHILVNQLKVEGFAVYNHLPDWPGAFKELAAWIKEGKLKYSEHVTEGFENMFDAFLGLFRGDNLGKAVVKA